MHSAGNYAITSVSKLPPAAICYRVLPYMFSLLLICLVGVAGTSAWMDGLIGGGAGGC